jgi:hypothetical protein
MPPRKCFVDSAHYAAMLAFLDGADRLREAVAAEDAEGQGWWAAWAARSLDRANQYLADSNAGRAPGFESRPEYDPTVISGNIRHLYYQAMALIPREHMHLRFGGALTCSHLCSHAV